MFAAPGASGYGPVMRLAALLALVAGCSGGTDDYRVVPGGPSHPSTPMVDAPPADTGTGDGAALAGRVCVITDLRKPSTGCLSTGAAGITVTLGTATTLTAADGSFAIAPPQGTGLVWHVGAEDLIPSVIPLTTSTTLPIVTTQTYLDLQNGNTVIVNSGEGSVVLYLVNAGAPLAGGTVTSNPVASYPAMGDQANPTNWVAGETGPLGASWTPGIIAGTTRMTVTPPAGLAVVTIDVPVEDGAITFATVAIP